MLRGLLLVIAAVVAAGASAALADEPFYQGKRVTLLVNFAPGGPTDVEGRLLAKHIVKHIAGHPLIIVQNKDGASGLVGAAYLGEVGPRDGHHVRLSHRHVVELRHRSRRVPGRFPQL